MRGLAWLTIAALLGIGTVAAQEGGMTWQDAVAELAFERTRAETCVTLLKRHAAGDPAAISEGEIAYAEGKAEIDAVVAGLVVVLAVDAEPQALSTIEARLRRGTEARQAFCRRTSEFVPNDNGIRSGLVDVLAEATGSLIDAAKEIYLNYRDEEQLRRKTIQNQLEATKWKDFAKIKP